MNLALIFLFIMIALIGYYFIKKIWVIIVSTVLIIGGSIIVTNLTNSDVLTNAMKPLTNLFNDETVEKTSSFIENTFHGLSVIKIKEEVLLDAPAINQFPELPRGCEVTSLAMLLQSANIQVDKLTLAEQITKDPTPQTIKNGKVYFGHPNIGFVGNMYTYDKPGYGVYHKPIADLASRYLPNKIVDLTGKDFTEIKLHLTDGRPVWVITNTTFNELPLTAFQTWTTPVGDVKITYKEHSVLLTGYDKDFVYFNDPLTGEKNKKAPIEDFIKSWVQMGKQAITYLP